ncbi:MAG: helix-turn-helix transcriptional regulator [Adlercreutzia sp.]
MNSSVPAEQTLFSTLYLPTEAIMALRPAGKLLGVVLLGLCLRRKERLPLADNEYPLQYGISIKSAGERAITLFATHRSWALIIAGSTLFPLIFGFVAQACSRLSTNSGLYDGFNEIVALGTIALLVFYGVWRAGRLTFDELLYFSVPLFATGCLLLPAFWLADAPYAGMLVKCGYTVNQVLFWVLLAQESYRDLRHTYLFFGLFYGIYELTTAAARLTTSALPKAASISPSWYTWLWWRCGSSPLWRAVLRAGETRGAGAPRRWPLCGRAGSGRRGTRRRRRPERGGRGWGGGSRAAGARGAADPRVSRQAGARVRALRAHAAGGRGAHRDHPRLQHGEHRQELFVSRETVKTHLRRVYAKVGVGGKQELIAFIDRYEG